MQVERQDKKKSNKAKIIVLCVIVGLIAMCGICVVAIGSSEDTDSDGLVRKDLDDEFEISGFSIVIREPEFITLETGQELYRVPVGLRNTENRELSHPTIHAEIGGSERIADVISARHLSGRSYFDSIGEGFPPNMDEMAWFDLNFFGDQKPTSFMLQEYVDGKRRVVVVK